MEINSGSFLSYLGAGAKSSIRDSKHGFSLETLIGTRATTGFWHSALSLLNLRFCYVQTQFNEPINSVLAIWYKQAIHTNRCIPLYHEAFSEELVFAEGQLHDQFKNNCACGVREIKGGR